MPSGASEARAKQRGALAAVVHEKETNSQIGQLIKQLETAAPESFTNFERANIREAKVKFWNCLFLNTLQRNFEKQTLIPTNLARSFSEIKSKAYDAWVYTKFKVLHDDTR